MGNILNLLCDNKTYSSINREERNLVAILYHLLLVNNNLQLFLNEIECQFPVKEDEMGIYFEYAFARDLWKIIESNEKKREVICNYMTENRKDELRNIESIEEFNSYFVSNKSVSKTTIQNPGRWNVSKLMETFNNEEELKKVLLFKWAFNIKPDIVIHTSLKEAVCIECKLESNIATYTVKNKSIKVFQTELQEYLMKQLLGIKDTEFVLISYKSTTKNTGSIKQSTWKDIFSKMNLQGNNEFIKRWVNRYLQ